MPDTPENLYSVRNRYAIATLLMCVISITTAVYQSIYAANVVADTEKQQKERATVFEQNRLIRDSIWLSREALDNYLLDPTKNEAFKKFSSYLINASDKINILLKLPQNTEDTYHTANLLLNSLQTLKQEAQILRDTRNEPKKQFPALALSQQNIDPNSRIIHKTLRKYIKQEKGNNFKNLLSNWESLETKFQLYLSNRMGSFNINKLPGQEQEILGSIDKFKSSIESLSSPTQRKLLQNADRGIILKALKTWRVTFLKIQQLHASNKWRTDANLLADRINPLYINIWHHLLTLEIITESRTIENISKLNSLTKDESSHQVLIIGILIAAFIAGYLILDRSILKPLKNLSRAMLSVSTGDTMSNIPAATNLETHKLVTAFNSMHEQIRHRQSNLERQALHDSLTGLPNRILFHDRVITNIKHAIREKTTPALFMIDLNRFKEINDTLGHHTGDELLKGVARRLSGSLRASDTIARLGGDEFAILIGNNTKEQAETVAQKLTSALTPAFEIGTHKLHAGASIGIARFPIHGDTEELLIQHADVAMYNAKRSKSAYCFYNPEDDANTTFKLTLLNDLSNAIKDKQLELYYQPKALIRTQAPLGAEALLRWNHPEHGFIQPDHIIEIAENSGLIVPLTYFILETAIHQCADWQLIDEKQSVAVNLSVTNLQDKNLVDLINSLLIKYNLHANDLTLEITESAMMNNPNQALDTLNKFSSLGIKISIDDFGTGYSSLSYLKQLPVDELKIDRSFVSHMTSDISDTIIVRSTIDLAHNMGLKVVAEGIEDEDTWKLLNTLNCDVAQGYHFARPMPAEAYMKWIIEQNDNIDLD